MQFDENICIFQDVFYPPEGYQIEWAELTTWSLAKDWLRMIAAMIAATNNGAAKARLTRPNSHIRAHKEDASCFHVFYDGKYQREQEDPAYYQSSNGRYAAYLFEHRCTPIQLESGLFHPKLILLQFKNKTSNEKIFRLFISSRNLTWSSYVESGVLLESRGKLENPESNDPGFATAQFLERYYGGNVPEALNINALKEAHLCVVTKSGEIVDENPKLFFGQELKNRPQTFQKLMQKSFEMWKKTRHPNLAEYFLRITSMNPTEGLLDCNEYTSQYICNFKDMYDEDPKQPNIWKKIKGTDNYYYLSEESAKDDKSDPSDNDKEKPVPLHAKHYMFWGVASTKIEQTKSTTYTYSKLLIWTGSANCSQNALQNTNEEVMLKFCAESKSDAFPGTKNVSNSKFGHRREKSEMLCFRNPAEVKNPQIISPEDEDDAGIGIKIDVRSASYCPNQKQLSISLKNNEKDTVSLWPATCSEADLAKTLGPNICGSFTFQLPQASFSRLLHIRRHSDNKVYTLLLKLTDSNGNVDTAWHGKKYDEIKNSLPLDPLQELSDLIPNQSYFSPQDNVYEKLTKCMINMSVDEFTDMIKAVEAELCKEKKAVLNTDCNEVTEDDDDLLANHARLFERTDEVNAFTELLESFKGDDR